MITFLTAMWLLTAILACVTGAIAEFGTFFALFLAGVGMLVLAVMNHDSFIYLCSRYHGVRVNAGGMK